MISVFTLSFFLGVLTDLPFRGFILFWYICSSRYHAAIDSWLSNVWSANPRGCPSLFCSDQYWYMLQRLLVPYFQLPGFSGMVSRSNHTLVYISLFTRAYPDERMRFVAYSWYITCTGTCTLFSTSTGNCLPVLDSLRLRALHGRVHSNVRYLSGTVDCAVISALLFRLWSDV